MVFLAARGSRRPVTAKPLMANPLPNGEPNYMWQDFLTREQFATVLLRYAKVLGIA